MPGLLKSPDLEIATHQLQGKQGNFLRQLLAFSPELAAMMAASSYELKIFVRARLANP